MDNSINLQQSLRQAVSELTNTVTDKDQAHRQKLRQIDHAVRRGQASLEIAASRVRRTPALVLKKLVKMDGNADQRHREIRRKITENGVKTTEGFNALRSDIQAMTATFANVTVSETKSGGKINFNGQSREAVLLPLLLLKPRLGDAISQLLLRNQHEVSRDQLDFLMLEFDGLLFSSIQDVASKAQKPIAHIVDRPRCSQSSSDPFSKAYSHERHSNFPGRPWPRSANKGENDVIHQTEVGARRRRRKVQHRSWHFRLHIGELYVNVVHSSSGPASTRSSHRKIGFSFVPRREICSTALNAWFVRIADEGQAPRLNIQLNTFTVIKTSADFDDMCRYDTVKDVDTAFRGGKASPFALDASGMSIYNVGILLQNTFFINPNEYSPQHTMVA